MALSDITAMTNSHSLRNRIIGAAAAVRGEESLSWVLSNNYTLCSSKEWTDKWQYATQDDPDRRNRHPDTGCRDDVIGDEMIIEAVTALHNKQLKDAADAKAAADAQAAAEEEARAAQAAATVEAPQIQTPEDSE